MLDDPHVDSRADELKSAGDFTPMPMANQPAPEPEQTYTASIEDLRQAGRDLRDGVEVEAEIIPREYKQVGGEHDGERSPINQTRTAKEAAADLANMRRQEQAAMQESSDLSLRERIDQIRAEADAQEVLKAHAERQAQQPGLQPQPEAQPQQQPPGVSQKIQAALADPEIRSAIQAEIQQASTAAQAYSAAAQQLQQAAAASFMSSAPELVGVRPDQLDIVMQTIAKNNPQRAAELQQHIRTAERNMEVVRQHQAQAAQHQWQQFNTYAQAEDAKFDAFEKTRPASEAKAVRENIATVLKEDFGIDPQALSQLYDSNPAFRSVEAQKLIYAAVRNSLAQRSIHKAPRPGGRVLRPGEVSAPGVDYSELTEKTRAFRDSPTAKSAAAVLMARRRAAARSR